jgi:hypothetical protein
MMHQGGNDRFEGRFDPAHVDCPHDPMPELSMPGDGTFHGEDMWIDVIRKMDDVYADLVTSQTALEERNVALEHALAELDAAHQKLRQTQQQLLTSEKMAALGRLVAGVAHELNNPISFVFGNMYALKRYGGAITQYLAAIDAGRGGANWRRCAKSSRLTGCCLTSARWSMARWKGPSGCATSCRTCAAFPPISANRWKVSTSSVWFIRRPTGF